MFRGVPVIDADSHKIENAVIFRDYIDSKFRDRIRIVSDRHGEQRVAITDRNPRTGAADFVRLYPQPDGLGKGAFRALHPETAMGALFNRIRVQHMDQEGIDVQVVYGSLTLTLASLIDADLTAALCRAYNDYIRDDCEPYRSRLVPVGVIPMQDVSEAVREMRRCVERLGMPAVSIAPNLPVPHPGAPEAFPTVRAPRHLSDPQFFPLYEAAQELGISLGIHGTPGAYLCSGSADQLDTFSLVHIFGHRSQQQMALAKLVMDGVLERFPRLRFGFLEAGCGWLPDLAQALHEHWVKRVRDFRPDFRLPRAQFALESLRDRNRTRGIGRRARNLVGFVWEARPAETNGGGDRGFLHEHAELHRDPREYFARGQIFTTFEADDPAPIYLREAMGSYAERIAGWSVDYGHWDGVLARCVRRVVENPHIDPDYAERLLSTNTLDFYGTRLRDRIQSQIETPPLLLEGPKETPAEPPPYTVEVASEASPAWSMDTPNRPEPEWLGPTEDAITAETPQNGNRRRGRAGASSGPRAV